MTWFPCFKRDPFRPQPWPLQTDSTQWQWPPTGTHVVYHSSPNPSSSSDSDDDNDHTHYQPHHRTSTAGRGILRSRPGTPRPPTSDPWASVNARPPTPRVPTPNPPSPPNPGVTVNGENFSRSPYRKAVPLVPVTPVLQPVTPLFGWQTPQPIPGWVTEPVTPAGDRLVLTPLVPTMGTPAHFGMNLGVSSAAGCVWTPHPTPAPNVSPAAFWGQQWYSAPRNWANACMFSPAAAVRLTGGCPLPGTDPCWTPANMQWPLPSPQPGHVHHDIKLAPWLVPNPADSSLPHLNWDIATQPSTARRITGRGCIVDLDKELDHDAVWPPANVIHILVDCFWVNQAWGPIVVQSNKAITVRDVLFQIYQYFQTPMTQDEVNRLADSDPDNYDRMVDAYRRRCRKADSLRGYEERQGLKRIDVVGQERFWWGLWVTYNPDGTWCLNLGLIIKSITHSPQAAIRGHGSFPDPTFWSR